MAVLGIDLSATEQRPSGICLLRGRKVRTLLLATDEEIVGFASTCRPSVVAIDAPLSLPPSGTGMRLCDRLLRQRGIPIFPVTVGAMRQLTERGIRLKERLTAVGLTVIEVFPGGAQDVLGLPRKQHNLAALREGLRQLGLQGLRDDASHDELDAVTAAYVGWLWRKGFAELVSDGEGGGIVMPLPYPLPFLEGVRLYQRGYYWHAHEAWEELWRKAEEPFRSFLKALIQLAAALIHAERGEWQGVRNLLHRVQGYLQQCPETVWGVHVPDVQAQVATFLTEAELMLAGRKQQFNWRVKPRINPERLPPRPERLRRSPNDVPQRQTKEALARRKSVAL